MLTLVAPVFGACLALCAPAAHAGAGHSLAAEVGRANPPIRAQYVGGYQPDGKFRTAAHHVEPRQRNRTAAVPPSFRLRAAGGVIEDYAPPFHARRPASGQSPFASVFSRFVSFAYGRGDLLRSPAHVTTDSRGRLIVTDPSEPAIHVLDGPRTFRIAAGPGRRLRRPQGIAVDAEDNLYVADSGQGLILKYDPQGQFLAYLGTYGEESEPIFAGPEAIAIDRQARRLYVLDSRANELTALDLHGRVIARTGGRRQLRGVEFDHPTGIAVGAGMVVVLDSGGSRVQLFNLDGLPLRQFHVGMRYALRPDPVLGLAVDACGNVYVSNLGPSLVGAFTPYGERMDVLARGAQGRGQVEAPAGIWIDDAGQLFVVDQDAGRVQVFRLARAGGAL